MDVSKAERRVLFKDDLQISSVKRGRIAAARGTPPSVLWLLVTARQENSSGRSVPTGTAKDDRTSAAWCSVV